MRTTLNSVFTQINGNLHQATSDMARINNQISSGRQMSRLSDKPFNLVSALSMRTNLAEIDQYQSNLNHGDSIISSSETTLTQLKELLVKSKNQALIGINAVQTGATREFIAAEVHTYLEQAVTLSNTQVNGKFLFGGFRSTGYSETEPTPFMLNHADGYHIHGQPFAPLAGRLTGTPVQTTDINSGDLLINGEDAGNITLSGPLTNGLNMNGAVNLKNAINSITWPPATDKVEASLTTLHGAGAETATGSATDVSLELNGITINYSSAGTNPAADAVNAINLYSNQTGVQAELADGTNGGASPPPNSIVLTNVMAGDESDININALSEIANPAGPPAALSGLAIGTYTLAGGNSGRLSLASAEAFELTSTNLTDDTALNAIGLGGGAGFSDEPDDGVLIYGYRLAPNELEINGISLESIDPDGISDVFTRSSAAAKAAAINNTTDDWINIAGQRVVGTSVSAAITPVFQMADTAINSGVINGGDLTINGIDIFASPGATAISNSDSDNVLLNAINDQQDLTGIIATKTSSGQLALNAIDGRNLHLETTTNGEYITGINNLISGGPADQVYFGEIQLQADRSFFLETTPTTSFPPGGEEPGLAALGLAGGSGITGETEDIAGDGKLSVFNVADYSNNVRYSGDRLNSSSIKVGSHSTIEINKNGQETIADTGIFRTIRELENYLRGRNFTFVKGIHEEADQTSTLADLNSAKAELDEKFEHGDIRLTVTDHSFYPPRQQEIMVPVDINLDTPASIAAKLNGIPGITSHWDSDDKLHIDSIEPARYTFAINNDSSNALNVFGIDHYQLQVQGLTQSLANLEEATNAMTMRISDTGARANRITVQRQIFDNLEVTTRETLSDKEDTDMIEALMNLKSMEIAYQAALNAAAKTMQMSLMDFL